ncbi:PH domain-containing protein [Actinotalea sp.]|uniref:PH domain-containing protein n=1 Tax=Actinotalea sp. TaxID=1872145 RepID=UPI0035684636
MTAPSQDPSPFDPAGVVWTPVSPRLTTVRLVTLATVVVLPLTGGILAAVLSGVPGLWAVPGVILAFTLWLLILIPRQVRAIGYAERDDDLLIRRGVMMRAMVVVPYGRLQFVDVHAGPLDRMAGVARVQLHTASASSDAAIPGLPHAEASRLRDRLASRGEARLAGL